MSDEKLKVLMLRHSAGFEHSFLPHAEVALKEIGQSSGRFEATTTHRCDRITAKKLAEQDVLVFATTGELPLGDAQRAALLQFVRDGKGFVGIHCATDTLYKWPAYGEMIGGYFCGHPWTQEIVARVEDADHPATRHLDKSFKLREEVYNFRNWDRQKTRVLISLDNHSVDLEKGKREDNDYALCWCHPYGQGRVIYTAFGHFDELWTEPWLRQHVLGCILWAAGAED